MHQHVNKLFKLLLIFVLFTPKFLLSNNLVIGNISLVNQNTLDGYVFIQFDLSWENSWRVSTPPNNWDAAWVFIKYSTDGKTWQHARINNQGHLAPVGSTIQVGLVNESLPFDNTNNPAVGAFVYRSVNGSGKFSLSGIKINWNYSANGLQNDAIIDVLVFAVEMVYIPAGSFYLGSGGAESGSFTNGSWVSGSTIPFLVSSENELVINHTVDKLWGTSSSGNNTIGDPSTIPAGFPKGYAGLYCMKYEISQQQYVDFLNSLTQTQANARMQPIPSSSPLRYAISGNKAGSYSTSSPYLACNYLSWDDGTAYAVWAGLRPMTELEYEKACRGPITPVANEYAWGTGNIASSKYTLNNAGLVNETIKDNYQLSSGNANYTTTVPVSPLIGPLRCGIFALETSNRIQSGASYYGIMEMSGNLFERTVTVANAIGKSFTAIHGNGTLTGNSHSNASWPLASEAIGTGYRLGSFGSATTVSALRVSDRSNASTVLSLRSSNMGFRAGRSLPSLLGE